MNGAQGHFLDLCPVPAKRPPRPRRAKRAILAEPPRYTGTDRAKVLQYITEAGNFGATDEEAQVQIPMGANTQRPRRIELVRMGAIKDSGRTRRTIAGHPAVVWILASLEAKHHD